VGGELRSIVSVADEDEQLRLMDQEFNRSLIGGNDEKYDDMPPRNRRSLRKKAGKRRETLIPRPTLAGLV
jgi:hypothetical protein